MFTKKNLIKLVGKHFVIALSVAIFAGGSIFFISKQITAISTRTINDRNLVATLRDRTTLLANLRKETETIGLNEVAIKQAFIPSDNILEFVAVLESLALKNSVTQTFHFSSPAPSGIQATFSLATINYQNTVSANIPTFINYLKDFERLPYFSKVNSISISSSAADWRSDSVISFAASVATQTIN